MKYKKIIIIVLFVLFFAVVYRKIQVDTYPPKNVEFSYEENDSVITLTMKSEKKYKIYYTLDGSIPNKHSNLYTGPIKLKQDSSPDNLSLETNSKNIFDRSSYMHGAKSGIYVDERLPRGVVVRAIAIAPSRLSGKVQTKTFFPEIDDIYQNIPIVSIVTDPKNLIDYDTGIYVKGVYYDEWIQTEDAKKWLDKHVDYGVTGNFTQKGRDWERDAVIEYFENPSTSSWIINSGIRIKGGVSRLYGQKSFNVYFRKEYDGRLKYPLFSNAINTKQEIISKFKSITLRNGGNDTDRLKFKDAWIQSMVSDRHVDTQSSFMTAVFINGEYWGVYNLQEKYSDSYFASHYSIQSKNVIAVKEGELEEGEDSDLEYYQELMSYAKKDLSDDSIYQEFLQLVDIQSMLDYYAIQVYIGNVDLKDDKNTLVWRTREKENDSYGDGRWRFSLFDLENSSALYIQENLLPDYCSLKNILSQNKLFARAMQNSEFNHSFYQTIEEIRTHNFSPERVSETLNSYYNAWDPYMEDFYRRFGNKNNWRVSSIQNLEDYFINRYHNYHYC